MMRFFIGYDSREHDAYQVCHFSLMRRASSAISIEAIKIHAMRTALGYDRPHRVTETGQMIDARDGRPFSTDFAFTRFLVPLLAKKLRVTEQWAAFCDCDFLFRADPAELFALADPSFAVMVVKHEHAPPDGRKMDGVAQSSYWRKNWSSLVLWNLRDERNDYLTRERVNRETGGWLHGFEWLPDDAIGALPVEWNWLVGHSPRDVTPKAVHFTDGVPSMAGYENCAYADEWRAEANGRGVHGIRGFHHAA